MAESVGLPGFLWQTAPQRQATPGDGRIPKFRSGVIAQPHADWPDPLADYSCSGSIQGKCSTTNKIK